MAERIIIDAGHGGFDNGASYNNRKEKDDALKLALAVGNILTKDGYDVVYTRTDDVYDTPIQKARIANDNEGDYFVSIHRNSSANPNQYNGVQTLIYNNSGIKQAIADNINDKLEAVGYQNLGVDIRPNLVVLKRTEMPAVLVEAGFINSDKDNELFDKKFEETAQAIASGIEQTLNPVSAAIAPSAQYSNNINYIEENPATNSNINTIKQFSPGDSNNKKDTEYSNFNKNVDDDDKYMGDIPHPASYQLLLGCYRTHEQAENFVTLLSKYGYTAHIYTDSDIFQVRSEEFNSYEDAIMLKKALRADGVESLLVGTNPSLIML